MYSRLFDISTSKLALDLMYISGIFGQTINTTVFIKYFEHDKNIESKIIRRSSIISLSILSGIIWPISIPTLVYLTMHNNNKKWYS